MRILALAVVFGLIATYSSSVQGQSSTALEFPRLGISPIGSPHDYQNPDRQAHYARYDVVSLAIWPGWESWRGTTMDAVARGIKSRNPKARVFLYVANNEFDVGGDPASGPFRELYEALNANGWWLYAIGGGGARVKSTWGDTHMIVNTTRFTTRNSAGENYLDFFARYAVDKFLAPNPAVDGLNLDNVFWKPRVDGDWNRDGVSDDQNNATVQFWLRDGARAQMEAFRRRAPGKLFIGNIADWGDASSLDPLEGQLSGGVIESLVGQPYSVESWGGWRAMMSWYRRSLNATAEPKLAIFGVDGKANDYRLFRYTYASCLLDDGIFQYQPDNSAAQMAWFDEYEHKLGRALSGAAVTPWKQGVYRRDFERGIVLVNPKGNGAQTLELEREYQRIAGRQDPGTNDGKLTRVVTIPDRDGLVLLRVAAVARPQPPSNVVVE